MTDTTALPKEAVEAAARLIDPVAFALTPKMYGLGSEDDLEKRTLVGAAREVARDKARSALVAALPHLSPAPPLPGEEIGRVVEVIRDELSTLENEELRSGDTIDLSDTFANLDRIAALLSRQPAAGWNEAIEAAAKIADAEEADNAALIAKGKGKHGEPGYVRDDVWNRWYAYRLAAEIAARKIRALRRKEEGGEK